MESGVISVEHNLAGRTLRLEVGRFNTQAQGTVTVSLGDTVLLATVGLSKEPREGTDFFPMMVDYEERFYAAGKIKGSRFVKREGRPSENAVLTSRLIDRPIRPLFPDAMRNDVQVICTVLSADLEVDPGPTGITAASAALLSSGAPFSGPVAAVCIGYVTDDTGKDVFVVNPTYEQCKTGKLDLVVAGTKDAITMVEAAALEVTEDVIIEALQIAQKHIKQLCELQEELAKKVKSKKFEYVEEAHDEELEKAARSFVNEEKLRSIKGKTKAEFKENFGAVLDPLVAHFAKELDEGKWRKRDLENVLTLLRDEVMREDVLAGKPRLDGRREDEIRPLDGAVSVVPRTHGSGLFKRGETQVLTLTTLGGPGAAQIIDNMDEDSVRRYMHHYNFPPFSVGEVKPMRGSSRREIGHGDLAERALLAVLPKAEEFPYTMRLVSEVLSCNGSSSMASICASSLSLMDAGVPISRPVAGIAMGLITSKDFDGKKGAYKILTDIQGLEDFSGDMDFKVAGTELGITALQLDIKVHGLSIEIMREALARARTARLAILEQIVKIIPEPRKQMSKFAPLIMSMRVKPEQIKDVIGRGGETINKLIAEFGVEIDIEDDGVVMVTAPNQERGNAAVEAIKRITYIPRVGDAFDGKVTRIMDFGAFVEFVPGKEGLVHISRLARHRVNRVEDVVKLGDKVKVKLFEIDDQGRYNLQKIE